MSRPARKLYVSDDELTALQELTSKGKTEQRLALRARIILLLYQGHSNKAVATELGISEVIVSKWRQRFCSHRLAGLHDAPREGRQVIYGYQERLKLIKKTLEPPEDSQWTVRALEQALADELGISKTRINELLRAMDLQPHKVRSWLSSKDPKFEPKMLEICGLYLNPPANSLVMSVDEKPCIQARGRKEEDKPMRPGSPTKRDFEYVRHGTVDLFAAFMVHEGTVFGKVTARHTAQDFISFLNELEAQVPKDKIIHLIIDNLSAHKTATVMAWFDRHIRWTVYYTPTHGSWLNQVELWFSILSRRQLKNGVFNSKEELVATLMDFIKRYNAEAKPFKWTYKGELLVI